MKMALTDIKKILGELILELAAASDARLDEIKDMVFKTAKTPAPLPVASGMEQIAAALIAIIPANRPVQPGSLYARLSLLITSLQIAARKDQWSKSVDKATGTVKYFPCIDDVYTGHCPDCGAPLIRFGYRKRSVLDLPTVRFERNARKQLRAIYAHMGGRLLCSIRLRFELGEYIR
ncbi:MAG: hypothetical protein Q4D04_13355, partial [Clostridia bacterium]|nr:hypothetical protein [Clostridia bacterium]